MSAQLTYNQTPQPGFKGMLAEQFSQRQVDSYIAEGAIISGDAVERGSNQTQNMQSCVTLSTIANMIGVALFSHHQENPAMGSGTNNVVVQQTKVIFANDFVTGDVVKIKVNNTQLNDVAFDTDNDTTLAAVAAELANAAEIASTSSQTPDTVRCNGQNAGESWTVQCDVTNGGTRTQSSVQENTQEAGNTLVYQDKSELPIMARGRVFCKANAAISTGQEVQPSTGSNTTWGPGTATGATKAYARTPAGANGDIFIVELVGP